METSLKNIGEAAGTTATEKVVLQVFHDLLASDYGELAIEIRIDSDMFDIGVSSIDLLMLRVYLEKRLGHRHPNDSFLFPSSSSRP